LVSYNTSLLDYLLIFLIYNCVSINRRIGTFRKNNVNATANERLLGLHHFDYSFIEHILLAPHLNYSRLQSYLHFFLHKIIVAGLVEVEHIEADFESQSEQC